MIAWLKRLCSRRIEEVPLSPESMVAPISPEGETVLKDWTHFDKPKRKKKVVAKRKRKTVTVR